MHLNSIVYLLVLSVFSINVVNCFEPITTIIGAAVVSGASYWIFGGKDNENRREKIKDTINYYVESCSEKYIVYNFDGLKADLDKKLFGQHIVNATLIPTLRAHVKNFDSSEKPLVMSFHGNMGTGKNHVSDLIVKHFYTNGENSKFVHRYYSRKDFPVQTEVDTYRVLLMKQIATAIKKCEQSIFIFDEVEQMPAGIFESIASILDYHTHVGGANYRKAIFIFLTNVGGDEIAIALNDLMKKGMYREQTKFQHFERIAEVAAYNVNGGFKKSSVIKSGLIDHFLPFLPLERRHIEKCVRAEYEKLNLEPNEDDVRDITENYASYQGLFSKYGCKRLNKKVQAMIEKEEW